MKSTPWLTLLEPVRKTFKTRGEHGQKGSLSWLEARMSELGGRAGTVRNIVYKDMGAYEEKKRFFDIISELYQQAGFAPPTPPSSLKTAATKHILSRDKRKVFARFARDIERGEKPQLIAVGPPRSGKSVLLKQLREAYPQHVFVNLANNLAPALHALALQLGVASQLKEILSLLSATQPYALQIQGLRDICALIFSALNNHGQLLFIRAETEATVAGIVLRDGEGPVSIIQWLEPLLGTLDIPFVLACSSPPRQLTYHELQPPNRVEARRYLRERLPELPPETLEILLNRAGNHYGELSRIALLELCRSSSDDASLLGSDLRDLKSDPRLGPFARILNVLTPEADPKVDPELLELLLEEPLSALSQAERSLLASVDEPEFRETLNAIVSATSAAPGQSQQTRNEPSLETLHERALSFYTSRDNDFRVLYHAHGAGALAVLTQKLIAQPTQLTLMPGLWPDAGTWPQMSREQLAIAVVKHHTSLGDYSHGDCAEALALLSASTTKQTRDWAQVKCAEAEVDAGQFAQAEARISTLSDLNGEALAESLLVHAALLRWRGNYEEARASVLQVLELPISTALEDRTQLWRGLVAKDAGDFAEARRGLQAVKHTPFLLSRARYQEGDILLRLGEPEAGEVLLKSALSLFNTASKPAVAQEEAHVRARLATAQRRMGKLDEAAQQFQRALSTAPAGFSRARVASEASMLESARAAPWAALKLASEAEHYFKDASERHEEALYRWRRTRYRLAAAYRVLQTGRAQLAPFRGGGASAQAQAVLESLILEITCDALTTERYASLYLDSLVLLALLVAPKEAQLQLERCEILPNTHLRQVAQLAKTETSLRAGKAKDAAAHLLGLRHLPPDPSFQVWRAALEAETSLLLGDPDMAVLTLRAALKLPKPFRQKLGYVWGQILKEREQEKLAQLWLSEEKRSSSLDLPEALALEFADYAQQEPSLAQ